MLQYHTDNNQGGVEEYHTNNNQSGVEEQHTDNNQGIQFSYIYLFSGAQISPAGASPRFTRGYVKKGSTSQGVHFCHLNVGLF